MGGLMMTEVMQAVSYLTSRPEVDGRRIAAMGYSMGSFVLSLACAVETRLHACVLVGGGNLDGPGGVWEHGKPMCQGIPYQSLLFFGDRPAVIYALRRDCGQQDLGRLVFPALRCSPRQPWGFALRARIEGDSFRYPLSRELPIAVARRQHRSPEGRSWIGLLPDQADQTIARLPVPAGREQGCAECERDLPV
jgi:hypothetical protein